MPLDDSFWENEKRQLLAVLKPRLEQMALTGMINAARQAGIAFDMTLYNQRAESWARAYTDQLLEDFISTSKTKQGTFVQGAGKAVADWIARPGATVGELNAEIGKLYGPERANVIAVTETTRAFANGQEEAYKAEGITQWTWRTNRDELVCPYCGGVNNKTVDIGKPFGMDAKGKPVLKPPYHPNCRCWTSPKIAPEPKPVLPVTPAPAQVSVAPEAISASVIAPPAEVVVPATKPKATPIQHADLKKVNLHKAEPTWKIPTEGKKLRYGGVIFDDEGRVLLRKPTGNFDGYAWTFPKGGGEYGEHPVDIAVREVEQETGHKGQIVGVVPGGYESGSSRNYFFVMRSDEYDTSKMDKETEETIWATPEEAIDLIKQTTNAAGRERDLKILEASVKANAEILDGKDTSYLLKAPPDAAIETAKKLTTKKPKTTPAPAKPVAPYEPPKPAFKVPEPNVVLPSKPKPKGFPEKPDSLTFVKNLGGSTGAQLMKDEKGKQFVVKKGASAAHLMEEGAADAIYQASGVKVPGYTVYETKDGPVKVSEYIPESRTLKQVLQSGSAEEIKKVKAKLQEDFVTDALLSNWDVIGLDSDNILVDKKGQVWRVDNGGSLRFRAQGSRKTAAEFDEFPTELWSLRSKTNPASSAMFGDVKYEKVVEQMRNVVNNKQKILDATSSDLREVLGRRIDQFSKLVQTADSMKSSGWAGTYQDRFGQQIVTIRKHGISSMLPAQLQASMLPDAPRLTDPRRARYEVVLKDQSGKMFDNLRGPGSSFSTFHSNLTRSGGSSELLQRWMQEQAGSSWNELPMAYKYYVATQKSGNPNAFYWKGGIDKSRKAYERAIARYGEETFKKTFDAYHAFTYELLTTTNIPNVDMQNGTITLWRTEYSAAVGDLSVGQTNYKSKRGAAESTSLLNPVYVGGDILTRQVVPLSNIIGTYLTERSPGSGGSAFFGDLENEFIAILGDLPFEIVARGR